MRGVFDDPEPVARRECVHLVHVHHQTADVNRDDADDLRLGRNGSELAVAERVELARGVLQIHVERVGKTVDEDRNRPHVPNDIRRRGERHCRDEHRLAGLKAERVERKMEGGRARIDGHGVARADGGGEFELEALRARTCRQPA